MRVFAAIDLMDGKAVRLKEGSFDRSTQYAGNALEAAGFLKEKGAQRIHVVNLKGALTGQQEIGLKGSGGLGSCIPAIRAMNMDVQFGGGIRTLEDCDYLDSLGVSHMIVGTAAIENRKFLEQALNKYAGKLTVAVDVKGGKPATKGWTETSDLTTEALCLYLNQIGVQRIVYTEISRDGMLSGPDLLGLANIKKMFAGRQGIVASGGITTLDDVKAIGKLGIEEAIIGCAIYENRLDLREAEVI